MTADIFVAVPAYHGADVLGETLRSIRDQTYPHFHALISLDGPDAETEAVARPFLADPRFELIVQPERLGWTAHFNWLVRRCDRPFFNYWQQDDLAATNYLTELRTCFDRDPTAAVAYADVQWFGRYFHRDSTPSLVGPPARRVLDCIEGIRFEPLRGLIRADCLPATPAVDPASDEGCHAEFPFLVGLAVRGAFVRTDATLYFKRSHADNTFGRWHAWPPARRRRAWIDMGIGFWRTAREVIGPAAHRRLLATILDRLGVPRPGRGFFFDPPDSTPPTLARLARDFFDRAGVELPTGDTAHPLDVFCPPIDPGVIAAVDMVAADQTRRRVEGVLRPTNLSFAADGNRHALGYGWSVGEPWGVWSDGPEAVLHLPLPPNGTFAVRLEGQHYLAAGKEVAGIGWKYGDASGHVEVAMNTPTAFTLQLSGRHPLELNFPDAVNLPDVGVNDPRCVGWGLSRVVIERAG
jgi:glycosyltransferase involved in cell wall biosynthesis